MLALVSLIISNVQIFEDQFFFNGTFEEGYGVSLYVTPEGELRTLGNDWDINDDGWLDAVIINEYRRSQDGYETYSYVFWGSQEGFDRTRCDSFFTSGAECAALADFNRDGWTDIIIANSMGESMHSYVIYGSPQGYTHAVIDSFKTKENHGAISVSDLNRDGWLDLVWSDWFAGGEYTSLYWGNPQGFSGSTVDSFPAGPAHGNIVADFDGDGYADIFWAVYYKTFDPTRRPSLIFWGDETGYDWNRTTELASVGPGDDISVADLNRDGILDIVIPNHSSVPPTEWTAYDYSYIHYGLGNRAFHKDSVYAYGPWGSSIGDIDDDGWLDIVFACTADSQSLIYYGSVDGFNKVEILPEYGTSCMLLADFDQDSDCDIILCRQAWINLSFLFQEEFGWNMETWDKTGGADAGITLDLGNPATRLDEYSYISPIISISNDSIAELKELAVDYYLTWQGDGSPFGAGVDSWVCVSPYFEGGSWSDWVKITDQVPQSLSGRAFRYRLNLHTGFRTSVVVRDVKLAFHYEAISEAQVTEPLKITAQPGIFTDRTTLSITGLKSDKIEVLKIFDPSGSQVRQLTLSKTASSVVWNGEDSNGNHLGPGTYFITCQGKPNLITKVVKF